MHFFGQTTSPWYVGKRRYGDYLYTRDDYLWGRGIRGPVLRQLWRTFCPKSDVPEKVPFDAEGDCPSCSVIEDCPFGSLRGSADEGEFKDKPRLVITNLRFVKNVHKGRVALATLSDQHMGVVEEKAPVFIEYLSEGATFEFEAFLMAEGAKFADMFESAVHVSLRFHGWGGFCNEGFGRGIATCTQKYGFDVFDSECIEPSADGMRGSRNLTFSIRPVLMLEKDGGDIYRSVREEGFLKKLCNCIDERYWQFYSNHVHVHNRVEGVSGRARTIRIPAWSRRFGRQLFFEGVGNELTFHLSDKLGVEEAKALTLARYGVGRYKNQGFGSLEIKLVH